MSEVRTREPRRWLNQSQFAAADGCDEKQVRRGLAAGKLVARADGKLDRVQIGNGWRRRRSDSRWPQKSVRAGQCPTSGPSATRTRAGAPSKVPAKLRRAEVVKRLTALDWAQPFEWTDDAVHARVSGAATAVGFEAAQSAARDDSHWGGYQLLDTDLLQRHGNLCLDAVVAGFGFELDAWQVLHECRERLHHPDDLPEDMEDLVEIRLDLLPLLAYPFGQQHRPPTPSTALRTTK